MVKAQRERRQEMSEEDRKLELLAQRVRRLPERLARREKEYAAALLEAKALRMDDILKQPSVVSRAWEREKLLAELDGEAIIDAA
jgi:hypothetical protein